MDERKYTTLVEALAEVPDPRKARGQRYPWVLLLSLMSAAVASGNAHGRAIGQWVDEHQDELAEELGRAGRLLPSESTLRRAVRAIDLAALEERIQGFNAGLTRPTPPPKWEGVAVEGKEVRGARPTLLPPCTTLSSACCAPVAGPTSPMRSVTMGPKFTILSPLSAPSQPPVKVGCIITEKRGRVRETEAR